MLNTFTAFQRLPFHQEEGRVQFPCSQHHSLLLIDVFQFRDNNKQHKRAVMQVSKSVARRKGRRLERVNVMRVQGRREKSMCSASWKSEFARVVWQRVTQKLETLTSWTRESVINQTDYFSRLRSWCRCLNSYCVFVSLFAAFHIHIVSSHTHTQLF